MQLLSGIRAVGCALIIDNSKTLVISDLHLGFEDALVKQGVLIPRFQYADIKKSIMSAIKEGDIRRVVLNGDVKHEFGRILRQEWKDILDLIRDLSFRNIEVIIIQGNHDPVLFPIINKAGLKVVKEYYEGDVLVTHGDRVPEKLSKIIIIGHEHPAISLKDKAKVEKFKCYLKGKYGDSELIVQPSFNPLIEGSDVLREEVLSPFLKDICNFEVFVVDEKNELLNFGLIKSIN